jgi:succinyl-CoA synthetase beta subunit
MPRLYEHQGKELFKKEGIEIPQGQLVKDKEAAKKMAQELGLPVYLKIQILSGGRGRKGGILKAETMEAVNACSEMLLFRPFDGEVVSSILVEKEIKSEAVYYMAVTADPSLRKPIALFSTRGGIEIEDQLPETFFKYPIPILRGFSEYQAMDFVRMARGIPSPLIPELARVFAKLYSLYRDIDARLVEINPLVLSGKRLIALDARIEIDDDAIFRHPELHLESAEESGSRTSTELEIAAGQIDAHDHRGTSHFIQVDPDGSYSKSLEKIPVGFNAVGTGAALTTMDELVPLGYFPLNFCDSSGNPTSAKLYRVTKVILSQPYIEGFIFISCISSQQLDNTARGIIKALLELYPKAEGKPNIPMVFAFRGAYEEKALELFKRHRISESPWVKVVDRSVTEKEAAALFHQLHQRWAKGERK